MCLALMIFGGLLRALMIVYKSFVNSRDKNKLFEPGDKVKKTGLYKCRVCNKKRILHANTRFKSCVHDPYRNKLKALYYFTWRDITDQNLETQ